MDVLCSREMFWCMLLESLQGLFGWVLARAPGHQSNGHELVYFSWGLETSLPEEPFFLETKEFIPK
jgi:hypothetical protein